MREDLTQLSQQARIAVQNNHWKNVELLAKKIQKLYNSHPEGYFLSGLERRATGRVELSKVAFLKAIALNEERYDAAIELASLYFQSLQHQEAFDLLCKYELMLDNSPLYLDMAARVFSGLALHDRAWPLFQKANQLQPNIDMFQSNFAACCVLLGKVKKAKELYRVLLNKYPHHQKSHYELSKLEKAKNSKHLDEMLKILEVANLSPEKNIFMYYAIGKELEDLGRWKESFYYYKLAGETILSVSKYDINTDISLIDQIIESCNTAWLSSDKTSNNLLCDNKTPLFIIGLPRTGTTLTERIISSHSKVESADETFFMQMAVRSVSGVGGNGDIDAAIIKKTVVEDISKINQKYRNSVNYRLTNKEMFIDKYPFNYLYLGFIAKAFPNAKIVYLKRHPMDTCFAMFKQSYFKFAYSLEDLGRYYVAQDKLRKHWMSVLGDRIIEVDYEHLVTDQEKQTRKLLSKLGLEFEQSCMNFEKNPTSSASASTLQVREKVHTRSVNKWKNYLNELQPLYDYLKSAGIDVS